MQIITQLRENQFQEVCKNLMDSSNSLDSIDFGKKEDYWCPVISSNKDKKDQVAINNLLATFFETNIGYIKDADTVLLLIKLDNIFNFIKKDTKLDKLVIKTKDIINQTLVNEKIKKSSKTVLELNASLFAAIIMEWKKENYKYKDTDQYYEGMDKYALKEFSFDGLTKITTFSYNDISCYVNPLTGLISAIHFRDKFFVGGHKNYQMLSSYECKNNEIKIPIKCERYYHVYSGINHLAFAIIYSNTKDSLSNDCIEEIQDTNKLFDNCHYQFLVKKVLKWEESKKNKKNQNIQ